MPASKSNYQVSAMTPQEMLGQLNRHLSSIADRLDQIEGIRGTASINSNLNLNSNQINNLTQGTSPNNAAIVGNLTPSSPTFTDLTVNGTLTSEGPFDVLDNDGSGTVIHSME